MSEQLESALTLLRKQGHLPVAEWPEHVVSAREIGLLRVRDAYQWPDSTDFLQGDTLRREFEDLDVDIFHSIGSTNTYLMDQADSSTGRLCLAEFQHGGRGRRGRVWISPYARNIAMSLKLKSQRQLSELSGLSSVVGLGLVQSLSELGGRNLSLKWPNDVLVDGSKLCGILVELQQTGSESVNLVIGVGMNVELSEEERAGLDQPATDLRSVGVQQDRTAIIVHTIGVLRTIFAKFEAEGFAPFVHAFNTLHAYHQQPCRMLLGSGEVSGTVKSIGDQGELILQTAAGVQRFHGGEVSMRPLSR